MKKFNCYFCDSYPNDGIKYEKTTNTRQKHIQDGRNIFQNAKTNFLLQGSS